MKIVLIGGGGHAKVVADIIHAMAEKDHNLEVWGFLDDNQERCNVLNYRRMGGIDKIASLSRDQELSFLLCIGDNRVRAKLTSSYRNLKLFTAIHPSAQISKSAIIGEGTVVMAQAVVNADTNIGKHVIVNTGAIIEHDCNIADFAHISPNATLCGNVAIGECTHVGAGAVIIQNKSVGANSVVGAGAIVVKDVPDDVVVMGVPARIKGDL